jgi:DNA-binding HxlR family transcriptional regulator
VSNKHQVISRTERSSKSHIDAAGIEKQGPIFIGRWTPKILFSLKERPYRHGELGRNVGNVSRRMLTRTLRNLESTGLITRRATRSRARAFEYSLTKLGRTIIAPLRGMCHWAKRYSQDVSADVHLPEAGTSTRK